MQTVYKYPIIPWQEEVTIVLPAGAKPLHVGPKGPTGTLMLWVLIPEPKTPVTTFTPGASVVLDALPEMERWRIRIAGTGHSITDEWTPDTHVGTVFPLEGSLVFHVFAKRGG